MLFTGCGILPTAPKGDDPIMADDPLFAAVCVDSVIPAPDGSRCDAGSMAGVGFTIPNPFPNPTPPACTLVLTSRLDGNVARIANWWGVPALDALAYLWTPTFEDCPDGFDPVTGRAR